jgi:hypothetical protein
MSSVKAFSVALIMLSAAVSGLAWEPCGSEAHRKVERFASVKYIDKVQGPAGIELMLEENEGQLTATLRDYEGNSKPRETHLYGSLTGCAVKLSGRNNRGLIEISGRLTVPAFEGSICRQIGKRWYSQEVVLKRELSETPELVPSASGST